MIDTSLDYAPRNPRPRYSCCGPDSCGAQDCERCYPGGVDEDGDEGEGENAAGDRAAVADTVQKN